LPKIILLINAFSCAIHTEHVLMSFSVHYSKFFFSYKKINRKNQVSLSEPQQFFGA